MKKVTKVDDVIGTNLRVLGVLLAGPPEGMRIKEVAMALDEEYYQQRAGTALAKLLSWGFVKLVARGTYALCPEERAAVARIFAESAVRERRVSPLCAPVVLGSNTGGGR